MNIAIRPDVIGKNNTLKKKYRSLISRSVKNTLFRNLSSTGLRLLLSTTCAQLRQTLSSGLVLPLFPLSKSRSFLWFVSKGDPPIFVLKVRGFCFLHVDPGVENEQRQRDARPAPGSASKNQKLLSFKTKKGGISNPHTKKRTGYIF